MFTIGENEVFVSFTNEGEYYDFLKERERNTKRPIKTNKDIILNFADEDARISVSVNGTTYPVADCAWVSLCAKIGIKGTGFHALSNSTKKKVVEEILGLKKDEETKIIIIDEMIRATLSEGYNVLPCSSVIPQVIDILRQEKGTVDFIDAQYSYIGTSARLEIPDLQVLINNVYNKKDTWVPGLIVSSSDTGFGAVSISPVWRNGNNILNFGLRDESVHLVHRGTGAIDEIQNRIPAIFAKLNKNAENIQKQAHVKIKDVNTVLNSIQEKFPCFGYKDLKILESIMSLRVAELCEEYEEYASASGDTEPFAVTAYDILLVLMSYVDYLDAEEDKGKIQSWETMIGKLFADNMAKYDL